MTSIPAIYFFLDIKIDEQHFRLCNVGQPGSVLMDGLEWQNLGGMISVEPRRENEQHIDVEIGPVDNHNITMMRDFVRAQSCSFTLYIVAIQDGVIVEKKEIFKDDAVHGDFRIGLNRDGIGRVILKNYDPEIYDKPIPFDLDEME